jgi:hypothetical protein
METNNESNHYRGLPRLLYSVRWAQHLLAIVAEVIILLSFAMSGMDVSLGGVMASVPLLKILWAGMFALGIDTAFALSWVRVRQSVLHRRWLALTWNLLLASGMSIIVFQPIAIQLLQQSLGIDFSQAVSNLGINIVFLTYARAAVAVALGAILAMTNVESETSEQRVLSGPQRKLILFERLLNRVAPIVSEEAPLAQVAVSEDVQAQTPAQAETTKDIGEQPTMLLPTVSVPAPPPEVPTDTTPEPTPEPEPESPASQPPTTATTPEQRAQAVSELDIASLSASERVTKVLSLFPDVSDRELGRLSNVAAATAKKHRETFKKGQTSVVAREM